MMTQSSIPTEALKGTVYRQLYHGQPHLVFVEHAHGAKPRCVCEVADTIAGYAPINKRMQFHGDGSEDGMNIVADYLREVL